ncbi:MAG: hypothetical protein NVS2B7_21970 [Herpetosiphon sp.]
MQPRLFAIPLLLLSLLAPAGPVHATARCFPEVATVITDCIDGRFQTFWEQEGELPVFGYPVGPATPDESRPGRPLMQRFERTTLELHPENRAPYDVLLSRAGVDVLAQRQRDWTTFPKSDPGTAHYFRESGHAIGAQFWGYWSSHGLEFDGRPGFAFAESLALFGFPVSEPQVEVSMTDGQSYVTQWFERARFEYHPELAGTPNEVLLGLLGRELHGGGVAAGHTPPAPTGSALPPGGFIQATGSQLTRLGQAVQVKGVNYYPQGKPWKAMWDEWNGPQIAREVGLAHTQLGINAMRVLVPYDTEKQAARGGIVTPEQLTHLREVVQVAGNLQMRVIVTLFDFDDSAPVRGSTDEQLRLRYLQTLVGNFVGDDRIMAWDVHNEPDQYDVWLQGQAPAMLDWLGRLADALHREDPNHLVTVGMSYYEALLRAGPDGRRPIDYSDMISVHSYNSKDLARELDVVRANTNKPMVLEEFGWPSGIACVTHAYSEAAQAQNYRESLAAAMGRTAGVFAWTLRDFDPGPSTRWDSREEHYGLYRINDSLKPAAEPFRDYPASALPSQFQTDLPLTQRAPNPIDGDGAPVSVPGSGHYVKGVFREAYELFGGAGSFGPPITEALVIPGSIPKYDKVVQYFTAGALELHPEGGMSPEFPKLERREQIKRLVAPLTIGTEYASGRVTTGGGNEVAALFAPFYRSVRGTWRLGAAISGPLTEQLDGHATTVQYFQNGRLQVNPSTGTIEAGNLGQLVWQARCDGAH